MDGHEFNKYAGAVTGALMIFLSISLFSGAIFHKGGHHGREHEPLLYASVEDAHGGGGEQEAAAPVDFNALLASASVEDGEKVAMKRCKSCHKFEVGGKGVGPHLHGVLGRDIASVDGFGYSGELEGKDGSWDWETLNAFVESPKGWAPGTKMAFKGLGDAKDRAALLVYLNSLGDSPLPLP